MIRVGNVEIKQGQFPDGTLLMKFDPNENEFDHRGDLLVEWYYENDAELFALICVKRHLDRVYHYSDIILYMPYIPNARQDRIKTDADVFTLKYFCEVINSLHFQAVYVRDAHSNVSLALLDNVVEESATSWINLAADGYNAEALFFPDEGAMKRYSNNSPLPYAFGLKKRDWSSGKILGLDLVNAENIVGKRVLIVDDICSRGGTFYHSAKALKAAGAASVALYVTHLEDTVLLGDLPNSGLIDRIYTTHSIFPTEKVENIIASDGEIWIDIMNN